MVRQVPLADSSFFHDWAVRISPKGTLCIAGGFGGIRSAGKRNGWAVPFAPGSCMQRSKQAEQPAVQRLYSGAEARVLSAVSQKTIHHKDGERKSAQQYPSGPT